MYAYVGLGANLGDRLGTLRAAAARLGEVGVVVRGSTVYETAPVGPPQPSYLNAALLLDTPLPPEALLQRLLAIEGAFGRVRDPRASSGPRTLDLDVLLLGEGGQLRWSTPGLVVPHPRLHERAFALRPLLDLDPDLVHPVLRVPLRQLCAARLQVDPEPPRPLGALLEPAADPA